MKNDSMREELFNKFQLLLSLSLLLTLTLLLLLLSLSRVPGTRGAVGLLPVER